MTIKKYIHNMIATASVATIALTTSLSADTLSTGKVGSKLLSGQATVQTNSGMGSTSLSNIDLDTTIVADNIVATDGSEIKVITRKFGGRGGTVNISDFTQESDIRASNIVASGGSRVILDETLAE
jgi:hypothetical protein